MCVILMVGYRFYSESVPHLRDGAQRATHRPAPFLPMRFIPAIVVFLMFVGRFFGVLFIVFVVNPRVRVQNFAFHFPISHVTIFLSFLICP